MGFFLSVTKMGSRNADKKKTELQEKISRRDGQPLSFSASAAKKQPFTSTHSGSNVAAVALRLSNLDFAGREGSVSVRQ